MGVKPEFHAGYDGLLCDLDGVVYAGDALIPGAKETISALKDREIPIRFVTNNASKSSAQVAAKLVNLGLSVTPDMVFTSGQAAVAVLQEQLASESKVLVVGTQALTEAVETAGFFAVTSAKEQPDAVIQGFSPGTGWELLAEASFAIGAGAYWLATNLDLSIPTDRGRAPGNGTFVNAIAEAVGRRPDAVAGKPQPALFATAATQAHMTNPLMVGDRLDTDIRGGSAAGFDTALVLTGIHTREDADLSAHQPTWIVQNLTELLEENDAESGRR